MKRKYSINNGVLVHESSNIPVAVYHGTTKYFHSFDEGFHKTELNENYQGDWFCHSEDEDVGIKYAHAARNQNIGKALFFEELKTNVCSRFDNSKIDVPNVLYQVCLRAYEKGYSAAWDVLDEMSEGFDKVEFKRNFFSKVDEVLDVNSLLDLLEFVEGSRYGLEDDHDTLDQVMNIFSNHVSQIPEYVYFDMSDMGFKDSVPYPRVICSYLKVKNFLETSSKEEAISAKGKYDLVIYSGDGCVDGKPEFLVADSKSILVKYHLVFEPKRDGFDTVFERQILSKKQIDKHFLKSDFESVACGL